jgi:hypothetical protein
MPIEPLNYGDAAKFHAQDLQRAMQRDQRAETKMLSRVRLILRHVLGHQNPPASRRDSDVRPTD